MKRFALAACLSLALIAPASAGVLWFTDSTANLGNAAVYTGATRDIGASPPPWSFFGCAVNTDQTGTLAIEDSTDGVSWQVAATAAIVAGTRLDVNIRLRTRYVRCKETNGATPQTTNRLVSSFTTD